MPSYRNDHGGMIVLPDGVEIAKGETAEISVEMAEASGVAALIEAGGLVSEGEGDAPTKTKKRIGLEAQAEAAGISHDGVSDNDLIAAIKAAKAK